jgi:hypothetical protein
MKRLIVSLFVLLMFSQVSWAQDAPTAEVFGGFSVLTVEVADVRTTPLGWQAAVAGSISEMFSLKVDLGGQYKNSVHFYEYMGGVQASKRSDNMTYFGHALFGAITAGGGGTANSTEFLMGYGGGVDFKAGDKYAVRAIQFDWLPQRVGDSWLNNQFRFGFGLVFLAE